MAIPSVRAVGTVAASANAITPGMPSGTLANDILLLFFATRAQTITVSGGTETWTELPDSPQSITALIRITAFWARASQDTPTSPTSSDSGSFQLGRMLAISGAITTGNPYDVTSGGTDTNADTSGVITGDTTTVADCLVVTALTTSAPATTGTTNFSSWTNSDLATPSITEEIDNTTGQGTGGGLGVATGGKASAGAYGNTTVTLGAAAQKTFMTIAIKPAATPPTTLWRPKILRPVSVHRASGW